VGKAVTPCDFPLDVLHRSTNRPSHIPTQPEVILFSICVQGEALPRRDGDLTMTKMGWNMMEPSNMALEATEMPHRKTWRTLFIHQPTIHRNEKLLGGLSTYSRKNSLRVWGSLSKEVWKSNFRQYGQMEKQMWEESEKRREEKKREDQRREKVRRQKVQAREKVAKPRNTVFFQ